MAPEGEEQPAEGDVAESADEPATETTPSEAEQIASIDLPVTYGDGVALVYVDPLTDDEYLHRFIVFKGYDGSVLPFTKRFDDAEMAVQTQFTVAEAYFELAKRHRQLGKRDIAREEIAQGRKPQW